MPLKHNDSVLDAGCKTGYLKRNLNLNVNFDYNKLVKNKTVIRVHYALTPTTKLLFNFHINGQILTF